MNKLLLTLAAVAVGAPASAAIPVGDLNTSPITIESSDTGGTFTRTYNGYVESVLTSGLSATVDFTFVNITNGGKTWNFTGLVTNTSSAPITASRVAGLGFAANPDIASASVSGLFNTAPVAAPGDEINYPQFPNGLDWVEFCFKDGGGANNCSGGGNGGLELGLNDDFAFSLTFANVLPSFVMSNFAIRFQSINGGGLRGASAAGFGTGDGGTVDPGGDPTVPEPSTWAMLIAGFGLVGAAARRRKAAGLTVAA